MYTTHESGMRMKSGTMRPLYSGVMTISSANCSFGYCQRSSFCPKTFGITLELHHHTLNQ
ncbi:hypothetical protein KTT_18110 [Tengunoibacter tsumagoiensis]|uniref:Uncharacterized protein n=1 Tax=Tengunoibacter tsumagoiensis TaxID=2014871 RepID=A0A401ZYQ4_9CHLR|nr:hypothetical protein KTT_18110 [Tengunoibacter tsumagoiensis]